jgi:hypothetical protein
MIRVLIKPERDTASCLQPGTFLKKGKRLRDAFPPKSFSRFFEDEEAWHRSAVSTPS